MGSWLGATNRSISASVAAALIGSGAIADAPDVVGGSGIAGTGRALGVNLSAIGYYANEQPFLNICKSGGSGANASNACPWMTATTPGGTTTQEEYALPMDSDFYPTAITASGRSFTSVWMAINFGIAAVSGVTYPYGQANVSYTVQFTGAGTIQILGDASATITSSGSTFTVATPTTNGLQLCITSTDPLGVGNYIRNLSVVETAYVSSFNSGAIFHPKFLAMTANYSTIRNMDWNNTNSLNFNYPGEFTSLSTSSGTIAAGATSCNLANIWPFASQSRSIYFNDGEVRSAAFIAGSTYVAWTGGLANAITTTFSGQNCYCNFWISWKDTWSQRSLPSNVTWGMAGGCPLEIMIAFANLKAANPWFNVPLTAPDSYVTSMANLINSGTGMQSGFSALSSTLKAKLELSNEVWNSAFQQYNVAGSLGAQVWPGQASDNGASSGNYGWNRNYFGYRTAVISEIFYAVMGSRAVTILGAQSANTASAIEALETTYWTGTIDGYTGPAKSHHISAVAIAPYWMDGYPSNSDIATINAQTDPVGALFACMTGNVVGGTTLSSAVPSNGWRGQAEARIATYVSLLSTTYPALNLVAYEGTQNLLCGNQPLADGGYGIPAGWDTLAEAAQIDARMYTQYLNHFHFWYTNVGTTDANVYCPYSNCLARQATSWGISESPQQTFSPESSAPYKWQACQDAIAGV
jgi:hypothetical protein